MNTGDSVVIDGKQWIVGEFDQGVAPLYPDSYHNGEGGTLAWDDLFEWVAALPDGITTPTWRSFTARKANSNGAMNAWWVGGAANLWQGDSVTGEWERDPGCPKLNGQEARVLRVLHRRRRQWVCGVTLAKECGYKFQSRISDLRRRLYLIEGAPCSGHQGKHLAYRLGGGD